MLSSLRDGFRSVARNWGIVALVLLANLAFALVLAVPLAVQLEGDLAHLEASRGMMYGFDYDWWSAWSEKQEGPSAALSPDILGVGALFRDPTEAPNPVVLGLGALYLLLQVFLTGGLLGVFRSPQGGWTVRGFVHGSGFYFGRLLRVGLTALAAAAAVLALNVPFARWVDGLAREAVSERTALALDVGRHALLLLLLVLVHMVSSHAKVRVVREERLSAALALLSSLGFCARNFVAALGQYLVAGLLGLAVLFAFGALDSRLAVIGGKSQLVALVLFQLVVAARIALRLGLLASQLELQARRR
jgi:hypothetical protein